MTLTVDQFNELLNAIRRDLDNDDLVVTVIDRHNFFRAIGQKISIFFDNLLRIFGIKKSRTLEDNSEERDRENEQQ